MLLGILGVLGIAVTPAGTAGAATNPVSGGTTTFDLKAKGVKVKAIAPATKSGKSVTLQNRDGSLDPATGAGTVETNGGFKFKNENGKVNVTGIVTTFGPGGKVAATVGKKNIDLATISGGTPGRSGFDGTVTGASMKLTNKGAKALNKKLSPEDSGESKAAASASRAKGPFKKNKSLGTAGTIAVFATLEVLPEGETRLTAATEPGSAGRKLAGRGVDAATGGLLPVAPASANPATLTFSFPITGGTLSPNLNRGIMNTAGGIKITKTQPRGMPCDGSHPVGISLTQQDLSNDFGNMTVVGTAIVPGVGTLTNVPVATLDLSGAAIATDPAARTVTVSGIVVRLNSVAADSLSGVFGTGPEGCDPAGTGEFGSGDPVGTLEFTAHLG
jgi:hypothetical protein